MKKQKNERILIFLSGISDGKYKIYFASPKIKKIRPQLKDYAILFLMKNRVYDINSSLISFYYPISIA